MGQIVVNGSCLITYWPNQLSDRKVFIVDDAMNNQVNIARSGTHAMHAFSYAYTKLHGCSHTCNHMHTYAFSRTSVCTCMHVHTTRFACVCALVHEQSCAHPHMCTHMQTYAYAFVDTRRCAHIHRRVNASLRAGSRERAHTAVHACSRMCAHASTVVVERTHSCSLARTNVRVGTLCMRMHMQSSFIDTRSRTCTHHYGHMSILYPHLHNTRVHASAHSHGCTRTHGHKPAPTRSHM